MLGFLIKFDEDLLRPKWKLGDAAKEAITWCAEPSFLTCFGAEATFSRKPQEQHDIRMTAGIACDSVVSGVDEALERVRGGASVFGLIFFSEDLD